MKIGVIGIGSWGKRVLNEYNTLVQDGKINGVEICDKNPELSWSHDYKEFLQRKDIDAVHICVPNEYHYDVAKYALEHGKHVLLEKPITQQVNQAYELAEIASREGLILQVGHIYRFANVMRKTKELMDQGFFGDIYYMTLHWTTQMKPMEGIDIIWDLLPHPLDMIHFLTGKYPTNWYGDARVIRRKTLNELAVLTLDYGDFFVTVELSWVTPERKRMLEIIGSKHQAKIDCVKQQIQIHDLNNTSYDISVLKNNTIYDEALNFIESIRNKKMPFNAHVIGIQNVDVVEKIFRSLKVHQ